MSKLLGCCAALLLLLGLAGSAGGQGKFGEQAPDFPPGAFSDGRTYSLADYEGRVVALYFFEVK